MIDDKILLYGLDAAIIEGNLDKVREILERAKSERGEQGLRDFLNQEHWSRDPLKKITILHEAIFTKNSDPGIVQLLIDYGADVNAQNSEGNTPLHYAARDNKFEIAKVLLANGAKYKENTVSPKKQTPLSLALNSKQLDGTVSNAPEEARKPLIYLLEPYEISSKLQNGEKGQDKLKENLDKENLADKDLRTGPRSHLAKLYDIVFNSESDERADEALKGLYNQINDPYAFKILVNAYLESEHEKAPLEATPLHWAVIKNYPQLTKTLLSYGANPKLTDAKDKKLADYINPAPEEEKDKKADTTYTDPKITTALNSGNENHQVNYATYKVFLAKLSNAIEMNNVPLFQDTLHQFSPASPTHTLADVLNLPINTQSGKTLFHMAGEDKDPNFTRLLLQYGADPFACDNSGDTPLHNMALYGNRNNAQNAAKILLQICPEVINVTNHQDETALHKAVNTNNNPKEFVEILIKHGADIRAENKSNRSPIALIKSDNDTKELLRFSGAEAATKLEQALRGKVDEESLSTYLTVNNKKHPAILHTPIKHKKTCGSDPKDYITTILHYAIDKGKTEVAKHIIEKDPALIYVRDEFGQTPLDLALEKKATDVQAAIETEYVKLLKNAIEANDLLQFNTLINRLPRNGHDIAALLNKALNDSDTNTLLLVAVKQKFINLQLLDTLLKLGAKPDTMDKGQHAPLHRVILNAQININNAIDAINILLAHGANPAQKTNNSPTSQKDALELLANGKKELQKYDDRQRQIYAVLKLHEIFKGNDDKTVKKALYDEINKLNAAGWNIANFLNTPIQIKDNEELKQISVLGWAVRKNLTEVAQLLVSNGAACYNNEELTKFAAKHNNDAMQNLLGTAPKKQSPQVNTDSQTGEESESASMTVNDTYQPTLSKAHVQGLREVSQSKSWKFEHEGCDWVRMTPNEQKPNQNVFIEQVKNPTTGNTKTKFVITHPNALQPTAAGLRQIYPKPGSIKSVTLTGNPAICKNLAQYVQREYPGCRINWKQGNTTEKQTQNTQTKNVQVPSAIQSGRNSGETETHNYDSSYQQQPSVF